MNTSRIKTYAIQARRDFLQAVTERANAYGIFGDDHIEPMEIKGDTAIIGDRAFPAKEGELRNRIVDRVKRIGFEMVMRSCAYTWFNRFVAIRYMEIHNYLSHGFRVLSNRNGSPMPEIVENAADIEFTGLDKDTVIALKLAGTKDNELYRLLILSQCEDLHRAMPFLFDRIDNELALLLPDNLLHTDSPVQKLVTEIDEADWNDVEIIGWIYQFYISERKDEVIGKVVQSEDIPAATQLFTPNWIVKYMVQNTLGRMWLATYPDSPLREKMEFYIAPAEQEAEVQAQLDAITPKELNPEAITFLDPACGSGHILVEAYDVFKEIYTERGYRTRDIPHLILGKNLFGLDICDRAAQLACFAVLMKAREDDRRILTRDDLKLKVMAIQESRSSDTRNIELFFKGDEYQGLRNDLKEIVALFEKGKTFGSLITIPDHLVQKIDEIETVVDEKIGAWGSGSDVRNLLAMVKQAQVLSRKYDCVVTNPPYMGSKGMNAELKAFARAYFPDSKSDLFAISVERIMQLVPDNRFIGFMTPFTWMFLSSYEKMRANLLNQKTLTSLIRPEYHAFFDSAYVPICTFTLFSSNLSKFKGTFIDLTKFYGADMQASKALEAIQNQSCGWRYAGSSADFTKIPGCPIAYWSGGRLIESFRNLSSVGQKIELKAGLSTGNNTIFQRYWHEVSYKNSSLSDLNNGEKILDNYKWYPCHSGGEYRKWYGNHAMLINWYNDGFEIKNYGIEDGKIRSAVRNESYYFKPGITWSKISSGNFAARYRPSGFLFDDTGRCGFSESLYTIDKALCLFCSKISNVFLKLLCPSLSFTSGELAKIPFAEFDTKDHSIGSEKLIKISKSDWDAYETSWDFKTLSILNTGHIHTTIKSAYSKLINYWYATTTEMNRLEEENNRIFINAYGLQDELTPDVPLSEITLTCNPHYRYGGNKTEEELETLLQTDTLKELISYAIGCMMGRYSLDHPGLIYAHSGNVDFDPTKYNTFPADDDGIIPVMDMDWFKDDATNRFVDFLKVAWSPETLQENLKFVADSLSPKSNEAPVDTIRRYLTTGFFKDHLKTYKKRPIYWLFSSGKQKAFECLVYLHRYNETTLSRMRSNYVTPLQTNIRTRLELLDSEKDAAPSTAAKNKLQKEINTLKKKQIELSQFDDELRHYSEMKIALDLDDGVKVNYGKFGELLGEVKVVTG